MHNRDIMFRQVDATIEVPKSSMGNALEQLRRKASMEEAASWHKLANDAMKTLKNIDLRALTKLKDFLQLGIDRKDERLKIYQVGMSACQTLENNKKGGPVPNDNAPLQAIKYLISYMGQKSPPELLAMRNHLIQCIHPMTEEQLFEYLALQEQHGAGQPPRADKGKQRETGSDVPHHPEPPSDRFGNQSLTEIFPKANLNHIADSAKRKACQEVWCLYAQAFYDKAAQAYPEILQHYSASQIYYKCYGVGSEGLTQLIAVSDKDDDKIFVGPSKGCLNQIGIFVDQRQIYSQRNMQDVSEQLQKGGSVQCVTHDVSKPLYRKIEEYEDKRCSNGLYLTDNYTQLVGELGGFVQGMSRLYDASRSLKTIGPWGLPNGAVQEQHQTGRKKPTYGTVERW
jgi:hypothetical protein